MKYFDDYKKIAGPEPEIIPKFYTYFAYKNGTATSYDTSTEAKAASKIWEQVQTNKEEVQASKDLHDKWLELVMDLWMSSLREDYAAYYPRLSCNGDELFWLIYNKAYDRGHSAGYDEVHSYFESECEYANEVINVFLRGSN